jgi:hypothetical protein
VLSGAAIVMLVLVSTFVAFGSWPGSSNGKEVDQVILNEVAKPKAAKVAVGAQAVKAARRAATRQRVELARAQKPGRSDTRSRTRAGTPVPQTPAGTAAPTTSAGTPASPGGSSPVSTVREQTNNATQNLQQTTQTVTNNVGNTVDKTTTQVNQVVDQVVGDVQQQAAPVVQQVQDTTTGVVKTTTDTVNSTTGSLLGH